jgi:hypothetical protein
MIHVAEAGEAKGRVVVQSSSGQVSQIALEAAVWLARAFQSEIESLYVENQQLVALAEHPFAREISHSGRVSRGVDLQAIEREFRFASAEFHRAMEACALAGDVTVRQRVVRDEPVRALTMVCADCGPWNAVALAEPFTSPSCPSLKDLLETVTDATGLLVVGPHARRTSGPIVIALENGDMLTAMLGAADRLSAVHETQTAVCLVGAGPFELAELEGATRFVLAEWPNVRLAAVVATHGSEAALAELLRRLQPGLVMGQFGGLLLSETGDARPLAASLECPLLLLR